MTPRKLSRTSRQHLAVYQALKFNELSRCSKGHPSDPRESQAPKMGWYVCTIFLAIFCEDIPLQRPEK